MALIKKILLSLIVLSFTFSCKNQKLATKPPNEEIEQALLLCQYYGLDQGIRDSYLSGEKGIGYENEKNIDSLSFNRIIKYVEKYGFPSKRSLGKLMNYECVSLGAYAILLHNPDRIVKEKKYFNLLLKEVEKGNIKREGLAIVLDKYYLTKPPDSSGNLKILYGSQFGKPCLKYRKQSDSVRAEIGLPPLKLEDFKECD